MRSVIFSFFLLTLCTTAYAQFGGNKFYPGYYYDINGEKVPGLINRYPSGKGIVKDEGFIEFKETEKDKPQRLSASMLHSFVIGRDSFIIAHAPQRGAWTKNELDFVQVIISGPTNLYMITGGSSSGGGGGFRPGIQPMIGTGIGTGGMGVGGGIGINLGGGGGGSISVQHAYYYGETTGTMMAFKAETFVETMTDVMGDEPDVVEKIREGVFDIGNIDSLVRYYQRVVASHAKQP